MTVLLRFAAGSVLFQVKMECLRNAILGLDVVTAVGLRPVVELDVLALAHPRH